MKHKINRLGIILLINKIPYNSNYIRFHILSIKIFFNYKIRNNNNNVYRMIKQKKKNNFKISSKTMMINLNKKI